MRVRWLPLMANSFAVSGMVIVEPGIRATTRSAAHMGSSSIGSQLSGVEVDCFFDRRELFCFIDEVFDSEYVQVQTIKIVDKPLKLYSSRRVFRPVGIKRLLDDLRVTAAKLIKDSIKSSIYESIAEELPQVEAQVQQNLHNQLHNIILNPMYKEFNAFNKLESQRLVLLQIELSEFLYNKMRKSIRLRVCSGMKEVRHKISACTSIVATNSQHVQDLRVMFKDMVSLLEVAKVFKKANAEGEK
ncbi:hypothetical protein Tco_0847136 [Tanacetum coccineum]